MSCFISAAILDHCDVYNLLRFLITMYFASKISFMARKDAIKARMELFVLLLLLMLSMRNALSRHPKYMSGGVLQPLQALQMGIDFGLNNERSMNTQVELLPQNQNHGSSSVPNSFHLSNPPSASMPSIISISEPVTSFAMESAQHHHASFPLPVSFEEILTGNMMQHQHPDARHSSINSQRK